MSGPRLDLLTQAERTADLRARQVRAIKAAQRQLGLDDETYRAMLAEQTRSELHPRGKRSATELTVIEAARVLDWMRAAGARNPKAPADGLRRPRPAVDREGLLGQVKKLLVELATVTGEPHGMAYADAIARRNGWGSAVDFCGGRELHRVVGALSRTLRHHQRKAGLAPTV